MSRNISVMINGKTGKIHALPTLIHHKDIKLYEEFQTHAFRLNNARQNFTIPFTPNWLYYPIDYQMSLDEDLMFYGERRRLASYEPKPMKQEPQEPQTQECPPEYFQDAQLPDDSMNIDEISKMFDIDVNDDSQKTYEEPEDEYICPDDHYGCCEKHIIEFEIDH
ncbi:unnamed protein product [Eruca vesicaria subsp. sativa]|uniref:Uncharacterized protein n=1 Tax=Eruca vesicaria subsp. sativa TaxID=29727 RepID=A0ABC8LQY7_ERUVS|nr:unnamed protein product [Eruca vesicaria subsp. sativa]